MYCEYRERICTKWDHTDQLTPCKDKFVGVFFNSCRHLLTFSFSYKYKLLISMKEKGGKSDDYSLLKSPTQTIITGPQGVTHDLQITPHKKNLSINS